MGSYRTIWDHTVPYGTIQYHRIPTGPHKTILDNTRANGTSQDHTGPYKTIWDQMIPYETIQDQTGPYSSGKKNASLNFANFSSTEGQIFMKLET